VVHEDDPAEKPEDLAGRTLAYNEPGSHSGWGAPAGWALSRGVRFNPVLHTGAHKDSLKAVAARDVDFAAIDARSFEVLEPLLPEARHIRIIGATEPSPGMTFITRAGEDPAPYRAALEAALDGLEPEHRETLGLRGVPVLPDEAYDMPLPPHPDDWRS
jgi:ABC-type phosphate/phosphonate transport system substrate-binding protein